MIRSPCKRPVVLFLLLALLAAAPVMAETEQETPERTTSLVVYGDDPCPEAQGDEIVVCARRPESERYRIPKPLRDGNKDELSESSWTARAEGLDEATRFTRPDSCSTVGAGGQTGCLATMLRQWRAERNMRAR
jgi:hypothetical protein